ncbi:MAG: winged helix DNA-binding domain-containing protein [Actinomycetota bacterium]
MPERVLSTRELNRALLARQLLLERSTLPLTRAIERIGGLQTQYAPSGYIGLWSRLQNFRREDLTRALERRRVIQATFMRATLHMVSGADYALFMEGIRKIRREWWARVQRRQAGSLDMKGAVALLRKHLAEGPRRQRELARLLEAEGFPRMAWAGAGMWLDMVRVPPSGTWEQRRADLYGLAQGWVAERAVTEAQGREHVLRRYLGAFGPAPLSDAANWAGLPVTALRPAVERLPLRRFRDEAGGELLDLPRAPLPDPETPAPVRFIPTWDAILLAHARRTQVLPEAIRPRVFDTKTPHSVLTFLVDGAVAGTWRYEKGRIRLEPFGRLPGGVRRELEEEGERLAAFHAD